MGLVKRHKVTNTLYTPYPFWFQSHVGRKWVIAERCKVVNSETGSTDGLLDIVLHSDIIQAETDMDSLVFFTNETREKYKKYEQLAQQQGFNCWFTDAMGVALPTVKDAWGKPTSLDGYTFIFEYMLITEERE
jgi:hypothetical protein